MEVATTKEQDSDLEDCYWMVEVEVAWLLQLLHLHPLQVPLPVLQYVNMYNAILQIVILWVIVPNFICGILISPITVMTQQPQVVVHINQAFCSVFIESVSFHIMYVAVGAPTPLCRRSIYNL